MIHIYTNQGEEFLGRFDHLNIIRCKREPIQIGDLYYEFKRLEPMDETVFTRRGNMYVEEIKFASIKDIPKNIYKL